MSEDPDSTPTSQVIDTVVMPDGTEFVLVREGDGWLVRAAGRTLMSSCVPDSEEALAHHALDRALDTDDVLVGGLGLGFTLRAVLDEVGADAAVTVAELVPSVVRWNYEHVGGLTDHPLNDPRCSVVVGDVLELIRGSSQDFDAILLDVDNGPVALSSSINDRLYSASGMRACHGALRPDGILAVWSAGPSARFERTLESADFEVDVVRIAARAGSRARHVLFIGRRLRAKARRGRRG